jgi:hypothetical protein
MKILEFTFETLSILIFVLSPFAMIWGWIRWARREKQWTILAVASFVAFSLATASALLGIGSLVYSRGIGGFPYYDPRLMRVYRWGALLSASGFILALIGVWRFNSLRWHAIICSFGMVVYWFAMTEIE